MISGIIPPFGGANEFEGVLGAHANLGVRIRIDYLLELGLMFVTVVSAFRIDSDAAGPVAYFLRSYRSYVCGSVVQVRRPLIQHDTWLIIDGYD